MLVGELGEAALLERMRQVFAPASTGVLVGIGDDAAVTVPSVGNEVLTTDFLLEGVHFRKEWLTPADLGRKSLAVNLSDLAAMGAAPLYAIVSLACPRETPVDYIDEICQGIAAFASAARISVIGGNTARSPGPLMVGISACGSVPAGMAVLRSGAKAGDRILVTGYLGSAAAGLWLLKNEKETDRFPELIRAFRTPEARLAAGEVARKLGASAMTDISDGLASDLRHICMQSGAGARIEMKKLPVHPQLKLAAGQHGLNAKELALRGGEDYELLIIADREKSNGVAGEIARSAGVPVVEIGEITPAASIFTVDADGTERAVEVLGFDHFGGNG